MVTVKELKQQLTDLGVEFPKSGKRKQFYIDLLRENTTSREGGSASGGAGKLKKVGSFGIQMLKMFGSCGVQLLSLIMIFIGFVFRAAGGAMNLATQLNPILLLSGQGEIGGQVGKGIGNACLIGGIFLMWSVSKQKTVMVLAAIVLAVCLFVV